MVMFKTLNGKDEIVVVVLMLYIHSKQLWSCPDHTFPGQVLDLLSSKPVLSAHTFASNTQLPFLNQWKEKRMNHNVAGMGIEPRTSGS